MLGVEDGSWELTPPTAIEFVKRDLRWCQGNLQYLKLIRRLDAHTMGYIQLLLAILMYVNAPAWLVFGLVAFTRAVIDETTSAVPNTLGTPSLAEPWLMLAMILTLTFAPKLAGTLVVLARRREAAAFGGRPRVLATALVELAFSILLIPLTLSAQTLFVLAMFAGQTVTWGAQNRLYRPLGWAEAMRRFWPQLAAGSALVAVSPLMAPQTIPWALLVGGSLLASVPFAVLTARPALGNALIRARLAATPDKLGCPARDRRPGFECPPDRLAVHHYTNIAAGGLPVQWHDHARDRPGSHFKIKP